MMELFYNTLAVVMGILAPFVTLVGLAWLAGTIRILSEAKKLATEIKLETEKKQPPYDNIELSQPPNPEMFSIRLIKGDEIVWESSYDKGDYL